MNSIHPSASHVHRAIVHVCQRLLIGCTLVGCAPVTVPDEEELTIEPETIEPHIVSPSSAPVDVVPSSVIGPMLNDGDAEEDDGDTYLEDSDLEEAVPESVDCHLLQTDFLDCTNDPAWASCEHWYKNPACLVDYYEGMTVCAEELGTEEPPEHFECLAACERESVTCHRPLTDACDTSGIPGCADAETLCIMSCNEDPTQPDPNEPDLTSGDT